MWVQFPVVPVTNTQLQGSQVRDVAPFSSMCKDLVSIPKTGKHLGPVTQHFIRSTTDRGWAPEPGFRYHPQLQSGLPHLPLFEVSLLEEGSDSFLHLVPLRVTIFLPSRDCEVHKGVCLPSVKQGLLSPGCLETWSRCLHSLMVACGTATSDH